MFLNARKAEALKRARETQLDELRRAMQDVMIAHAAVCRKHLTSDQFAAIQKEWSQLTLTRGWLELFKEESSVKPTPRWTTQGK